MDGGSKKKRIQPQVVERVCGEQPIQAVIVEPMQHTDVPLGDRSAAPEVTTSANQPPVTIETEESKPAAMQTEGPEHEGDEHMEEEVGEDPQQIAARMQREYETWKSNTQYLYSFLTTHETEFPYSTTFDWGLVTDRNSSVIKQQFYYGTNVYDEASYVIRGTVSIPTGDVQPTGYIDGMVGQFDCDERVESQQIFPHSGDVRRLRVMPQNKNICVTTSSDGNCYIFNFDTPQSDPVVRTPGGGFGLSWSPTNSGTFAVCEGGNIHIFTVDREEGVAITNAHDSINDVSWNYKSPLILSVGEDSRAVISDTRTMKPELVYTQIHNGDGNACSFDPVNTDIFITGGGVDGAVRFWDMRMPNTELCHLQGATAGINCCYLSPAVPGFVVAASKDHHVRIYDMSKVGEDQTSNDADDGGSEFLVCSIMTHSAKCKYAHT